MANSETQQSDGDPQQDEFVVDISVIIPCYNSRKFVSTAVKSACFQQGLRVEVIAVDDGSSDRTLRLLRKLEKEFRNLRVIEGIVNQGQASARNLGIRHARGRWIAFLDSDDFYNSNVSLRDVLERAEDKALDVLLGGAIRIVGHRRVPKIPRKLDATTLTSTSLWQLVVRRGYLQRKGIQFDESLPQREDKPFTLSVLTGTKKIALHSEPLIVNVARGGSTMRSAVDKNQIRFRIRHMEAIREIMLDNRVNRDLQKALTTRYLSAALSPYWARPMVDLIRTRSPGSEELTRSYMKALHLLTLESDSLALSSQKLGQVANSCRSDILRLVAESGRLDFFERILRGKRLSHAELQFLVENSQFYWAQSVATTYLKHHMSSWNDLLERQPGAPKLSTLAKRVVVHLGYPKTGTSALQEWMEENRFALLEEGIWFPIVGSSRGSGLREDRTAGHAALLRMLSNPGTSGPAIDALANEIALLEKPVQTVFLSSEMPLSPHWWKNPEGKEKSHQLRKIRSSIPIDSVDVMVVARPPLEWVARYYKEIISNPFNAYAPPFLTFARLIKRSKLVDIEILFALLNRVFAPGRVWMSSYREVLQEGGIVSWVMKQIGNQPKNLEISESFEVNRGLSDAQAFVLREAKRRKVNSTAMKMVFRNVLESEELENSSFELVPRDELDEAGRILSKENALFSERFYSLSESSSNPAATSPEPDFRAFLTDPHRKLRFPVFYSRLEVINIRRNLRWLKSLARSGVSSILKHDRLYTARKTLLHEALRWSHRLTNALAHRQIARRVWNFG